MPGTHDCGGEAAAYVLGALEPAEAEAFTQHLDGCAICRDELTALEQVVHALPMAAPQHPAPARLRQRVMHAVREEAKPAASPQSRRAAWSSRRSWPARALVVAGSCAAVALAIFVALNLSGSGGVRVIRAQVAGVSGSASVRIAGGHGELIVRHLSPPPRGQIYELWLKRGRSAPAPTSVLFSVTSAGMAEVGLPSQLRGVTQVMVTPEPRGGSKVPTHKPVIVAPLT